MLVSFWLHRCHSPIISLSLYRNMPITSERRRRQQPSTRDAGACVDGKRGLGAWHEQCNVYFLFLIICIIAAKVRRPSSNLHGWEASMTLRRVRACAPLVGSRARADHRTDWGRPFAAPRQFYVGVHTNIFRLCSFMFLFQRVLHDVLLKQMGADIEKPSQHLPFIVPCIPACAQVCGGRV